MKKYSVLSLVLSTIFVFVPMLLPQTTHASTLFLDEFNGTGELHSYNNAYVKFPYYNGYYSPDMTVASDHLVINTTVPEHSSVYLYTGMQSEGGRCASMDFKQDASVGTWNTYNYLLLRTLPDESQKEEIRIWGADQGNSWAYVASNGVRVDGNINYDPYQWHTLKGCINGDTVTAYLDNTQFFQTQNSLSVPGYFGFLAEYPNELDNFMIETAPALPSPSPTPTPAPTSILSGNVYVDTNQNGVKDTGETNYTSATVTVSTNPLRHDTTDTNGNYTFTGLPAGSYSVSLQVPCGYMVTTTNPVSVSVGPDATVNFGIVGTPTNALFCDQFNGTGELHNYNNAYIHLLGYGGGDPDMFLATDHLVLNTTVPEGNSAYLYTGLQSEGGRCASMDFKQDNSLGTWNTYNYLLLRTTPDQSQKEEIRIWGADQGNSWAYVASNGVRVDGNINYDPYQWHTLKGCISGTTVTAYLDNTQFFQTQNSESVPGYFGFMAEYPNNLDNFRVETLSTNHAPSVGAITASPNPVTVNTTVTASANFTDADTSDTHTATATWGDGSNPQPCTITESNGSGSVTCTHQYSSANVYPVSITVSDGILSGTSPVAYISVYNPTQQGIFTAASKYTSPAGAYVQNLGLTGTVLFGLSYKYQGTMPVGVRQFSLDFNAANFHFNATSISSLVIANGVGTLRGSGTLNGSGTYSFLVTGSESANTIRVQIKDSLGSTVYDTQPGAADTATPTTTVTGTVLAH